MRLQKEQQKARISLVLLMGERISKALQGLFSDDRKEHLEALDDLGVA